MPPSDPGAPSSAPEGLPPAPSFARQVLTILAKDLYLEWRSREIVYTMLLFAALVVVIFSFAFVSDTLPMADVAGGVLWVVVVFAGTLGLSRLFGRELTGDTHRALLISPVDRAALYLAKVLGVLLMVGLVEGVVLLLVLLLFGLEVASWGVLLLLLVLGTTGFALVGCLFAATLLQSRGREVLLGILLYPIVTPVIIAGAKGTAALLAGPEEVASAYVWLRVLVGFDVVFLVLSLWSFGPLARQE